MNGLIVALVAIAIVPTVVVVVTHFVMRRKQVEVAATVVEEVVSQVKAEVTGCGKEQAQQLDHIEHLIDSAAEEQQKRINQLTKQLTDTGIVPAERAPAPPTALRPAEPSSDEEPHS